MILTIATLILTRPNISKDGSEGEIYQLIKKMTLAEKLNMISGVDGFYTYGIPRLGIPRFRMSDGPLGLRNQGPSTAYPAGVTLAASWDPELAHAYGNAIGIDARARGVYYWLGPGVDLDRIPQNGRNFEYLGEDPFLTSSMDVPIIRGVQAQGVAATVKHFACNDNEIDRQTDDSIVDERTLHEVQLVPFEAAVKKGHVWALMDSYNLINGEHASQNKILLTDILKDEWGFKGVVMSDWGATHDGVAAFNAGEDLEMPSGDYMNSNTLLPLLASGKISQNLLNDKVARLLRVAFALHWMDRPQKSGQPWVQAKNDAVALRIAEEGTTLLANPGHILPLKPNQNVVVVGPNADPAVTNGGGSSFVDPHYKIGLVTSIKKEIPGARVTQIHYQGSSSYVCDGTVTSASGSGWKMQIYKGMRLQGPPVATETVGVIQNDWSDQGPSSITGHDNYSVRWTGNFSPEKTGDYLLRAQSDDGMRVFVDGKKVIDMWRDQAATEGDANFHFAKGNSYSVEIDYYQNQGGAIANFGISDLSRPFFTAEEIAQIKRASVIVAAVGFNPNLEAEGQDRSYELPARQQRLLNSILKMNKPVIMILNAGSSVKVRPFVKKGAALIDSYYPGENGDEAVAKILYGQLNPSGKLPFVFPEHLKDLLTTGTYPAIDHKIFYKEGVFIGQRGLDKQGIHALFPFGYGLSYSQFDDLKAAARTLGTGAESRLQINGSLYNASEMAGDDTVEAFIEFPHSKVPRPVGQLEGFARVSMAGKSSQTFRISILLKSLGYWDVSVHNWRVVPGTYHVVLSDQGLMPYGRKIGNGNGWGSTFKISNQLAAEINKEEKP